MLVAGILCNNYPKWPFEIGRKKITIYYVDNRTIVAECVYLYVILTLLRKNSLCHFT